MKDGKKREEGESGGVEREVRRWEGRRGEEKGEVGRVRGWEGRGGKGKGGEGRKWRKGRKKGKERLE